MVLVWSKRMACRQRGFESASARWGLRIVVTLVVNLAVPQSAVAFANVPNMGRLQMRGFGLSTMRMSSVGVLPVTGQERREARLDEDGLCRINRDLREGTKTRYVTRVMYDGTHFQGYQLQPGGRRTVQGILEEKLTQRYQIYVPIVASGRTDQGVHARGQTVHFDLPNPDENMDDFMSTMNRMLPDDVRVWNASHAPPPWPDQQENSLPWHSMTNARSKVYSYRLFLGDILSPLDRLYRVHAQKAALCRHIDRDLMLRSLPLFIGKHDFGGFGNKAEKKAKEMIAHGKQEFNTVREIYSATAVDEGGGNLRLEFHIDGALYRMVRNIVGTMLAVGAGRVDLDVIEEIFSSGVRPTNKIYSAPPEGLTLETVLYDEYR
ncbi:unnamed protein product [Choristocarpus tenellus]